MPDTTPASSPRVAIVTGANRGLGLATSRALAERGYTVVVTARTQAKADAAVEELRASDAALKLHPAAVDVSDDASVDALFAWFGETFDRLDVLVNNAGAIFERDDPGQSDGALAIQPATLNAAFNTNTVGAFRMLRTAAPWMRRTGYGRVVNVSSGMGALSDMGSGWPAYRLSKASLNALTLIADQETPSSVKVNAVCPGWVRTDMGGAGATRSVAEGIRGIVWAATLPDDGPSGGFFRDGARIAW